MAGVARRIGSTEKQTSSPKEAGVKNEKGKIRSCGASAPPIVSAFGICSSQGGVINRKGGVFFVRYRASFTTFLMNWM